MTTRIRKGYGWIPQLPDHRDHKFLLRKDLVLPPSVDLRGVCPPIYDQGDLGSCTANMGAGMFQFCALKEAFSDQAVPSRLFIYYNERLIDGDVASDSGAQCRDALKVIQQYGSVPETEWPYDIRRFTVKPSQSAYDDATCEKNIQYLAVNQDRQSIQQVLAGGLPVGFGFTVYASFESDAVASSGVVPLPSARESVLGGHAVMLVGYDDSTQRYIVRNSWGASWGMTGYCTMPYSYVEDSNLASDFWVLQTV